MIVEERGPIPSADQKSAVRNKSALRYEVPTNLYTDTGLPFGDCGPPYVLIAAPLHETIRHSHLRRLYEPSRLMTMRKQSQETLQLQVGYQH